MLYGFPAFPLRIPSNKIVNNHSRHSYYDLYTFVLSEIPADKSYKDNSGDGLKKPPFYQMFIQYFTSIVFYEYI
jgi:hypothetical protein